MLRCYEDASTSKKKAKKSSLYIKYWQFVNQFKVITKRQRPIKAQCYYNKLINQSILVFFRVLCLRSCVNQLVPMCRYMLETHHKQVIQTRMMDCCLRIYTYCTAVYFFLFLIRLFNGWFGNESLKRVTGFDYCSFHFILLMRRIVCT